ncbi:MAG: ScyD/ScyE family protein [Candidatus Solibacter sp.]
MFGASALGFAQTQQATLFASGLSFPSKIIAGPGGSLLAAETGTTPNSGVVSVISPSGTRTTLIEGLPSGLSVPNNDPDGPNGLLLDGNTLYIVVGEGDLYVPGPAQGTLAISTKGISSPIFDSVLQVTFPQSVERFAGAFTLKIEDHTKLLDGAAVTLANAAGDKATATLLTEFRFRPDAREVIKHSHPFGIARLDSDPTHLYVNDAGLNLVHQIDLPSGKKRTLVQFPSFPNVGPSQPPVVDAVPTNTRVYGNQLLVSFLTGFPFTPGDAKVLLVDPATGATAPFISWLNSTIDVAYRPRAAGSRPQFWALEYSTNMLAGAPGRVLQYDSAEGTVLVDGLKGPSSLAIDSTAGKLYIASRSEGKIYSVNIGQ